MSKDDRVAIEALVASAGAQRLRWFRHFIYVPDPAKAEALAAKLRLDGFEVESRMGADNSPLKETRLGIDDSIADG